MGCVKILVPSNDPNHFCLTEAEIPDGAHSLEELIPDFFVYKDQCVRIAVVCGPCIRWTTERFVEVLHNDQPDRIIIAINRNDLQQKVYATNVCASTADEDGDDLQQILSAFFGVIREILVLICEKLTPNNGNEADIENAKESIRSACTLLKLLEKKVEMCLDEVAHEITGYLDNARVSNGCPAVIVLVFLPEPVFTLFDDHANCFFKQIEYVLHFEDPNAEQVRELKAKIQQLEDELEKLRQEVEAGKVDAKKQLETKEAELALAKEKLDAKEAELEAAKTENGILKKENAILKADNATLKADNAAKDQQLTNAKKRMTKALIARILGISPFRQEDILSQIYAYQMINNELELIEKVMDDSDYGRFIPLPRDNPKKHKAMEYAAVTEKVQDPIIKHPDSPLETEKENTIPIDQPSNRIDGNGNVETYMYFQEVGDSRE